MTPVKAIYLKAMYRGRFITPFITGGGPLAVINGVITPTNGLIHG